jgi:hypothetical protein
VLLVRLNDVLHQRLIYCFHGIGQLKLLSAKESPQGPNRPVAKTKGNRPSIFFGLAASEALGFSVVPRQMEKVEDHAHNRVLAGDLLQTGHGMLQQLDEITSQFKIDGMVKLRKRVVAEVEFMDSVRLSLHW